jgi:hypothetical protein
MSNPSVDPVLVGDFMKLFRGLKDAYGTGKGSWIRNPVRPEHFAKHLRGEGSGLGIGPLMPDNNVWFAAIDLDEPNFELAREMQEYIPGTSWIERTRSGNVHVWVFFKEPLEAWVAMGMLKDVCVAVGRKHTEVFPKNHNFAKVDLGNYINLPFHGVNRPILCPLTAPAAGSCGVLHPARPGGQMLGPCYGELTVEQFVAEALRTRNDPETWRRRAQLLMISDPAERDARSEAKFGRQKSLHICAEHVIANCEDNPVRQGHRSVVFFALAKQLTNWELCTHDEAWEFMLQVNNASPDPAPVSELRRILRNAEEKQYTSTGCDDPVFAPYAHPDCSIANGG